MKIQIYCWLKKWQPTRMALPMVIACGSILIIAGAEVPDGIRGELQKKSSIEAKLDYLTDLISAEQIKIDLAKSRKAEALILLAQSAGTNVANITNVVETLVSNLAFEGQFQGYRPAVEALAVIGEPAVPRLLKVFEDSSDADVITASAQALAEIKRQSYPAFVRGQQDKMTPRAWQKLSKARAVID